MAITFAPCLWALGLCFYLLGEFFLCPYLLSWETTLKACLGECRPRAFESQYLPSAFAPCVSGLHVFGLQQLERVSLDLQWRLYWNLVCVYITEAFSWPCDSEGTGHCLSLMALPHRNTKGTCVLSMLVSECQLALECQLKGMVFCLCQRGEMTLLNLRFVFSLFSITALTKRSKSALPAGLIPP